MINTGIEKWEGPYLKKALPNDPWTNRFTIRAPDPMANMTFFLMGAMEHPAAKVKTRMSRAGNNPVAVA